MTLKGGFILGLVQGFTEFLPVSSSGHLVLAGKYLNLGIPGVSFSIALHVGTLFSTLVMLRKEILWLLKGLFSPDDKEHRTEVLRIAGYLILASIPAAVVGMLLEDTVDTLFSAPVYSGIGLLITGIILFFFAKDERHSIGTIRRKPFSDITFGTAALMGLFQAAAIMPGISRSGSTISAGLIQKVDREDAARFSFLMATAVIAGGALLDFGKGVGVQTLLQAPTLVGLLTAFISGILALRFVVETLRKGTFKYFSYYCFALGILTLILELK